MKSPRVSLLGCCLLALSVLAVPNAFAALYVYEGFQYGAIGEILEGQPDGSGSDVDATGLGGVWDDQLVNKVDHLDIFDGSLTFGDLAIAGNSVGSATTNQENLYWRSMTDPDIGTGSDLYFSILIQPNDSNTASRSGMVISEGNIVGGNGRFDQITSATGIGVGSEGNANFRPYVFDGATQATSTGSLSTTDGEIYFLVGHLSFNTGTAGADQFSLYNYNLDTSGGVVTANMSNLDLIGETLEVDLTEADLDVLNLTRQRRPTYDEIRVGSTLADVIVAIPEPSAALLGGLGTLLLLRRRRG